MPQFPALRLAAALLIGLLTSLPGVAADCPAPLAPPTAQQVAAAQQAARDRGVLWRLTKDGHSSWLYGTLHVGQLDWMFPGPRLLDALRESDVVALEIDLSDPAVMQGFVAGLQALVRREASHPLPAELRQRLAAAARAECLPPEALASQPQALQVTTLSLAAARRDGLEAAYAQEALLTTLAQRAGKPLVSLETAQIQLQELAPDDPAETLELVRQSLDELASGSARQQMRQLAQWWQAGRLDRLSDYEAWCHCKPGDADYKQLQRMNDRRNPGMADGITTLHNQGKRVLAAVGSLHMTGPQALPTLLQARGFVVERVQWATE